MVEKKKGCSGEGNGAYAKAPSHKRQVPEIPGSSYSLEIEQGL